MYKLKRIATTLRSNPIAHSLMAG